MSTAAAIALHRLSGAAVALPNAADDMRRRTVTDTSGRPIGTVRGVFVDDGERKARMLLVGLGRFSRFGGFEALVPVDVITGTTITAVFLGVSADRVSTAPGFDADRINDPVYLEGVYDHFGTAPYWSDGYTYPDFNR